MIEKSAGNTRTAPTVAQMPAFAAATPRIMATTGNGKFRMPGVQAWRSLSRAALMMNGIL